MAFINPLRDIILISPLKWDAWNNKFKTKAKSNDLWAYTIDGKKLLKRPTKLKASDFLKYIHQNR